MDSEEDKEKSPEQDFGKVVDTLHTKQKLSSLRTYQGDMAEFIKEKNESVLSISAKEKKRQEEREKIEKKKEKEYEEERKRQEKNRKEKKEENKETKIEAKTELKTWIKMDEKEEAFHKPKRSGLQMNIVTIISSLLLITLGIFAALYAFKFINKGPVSPVVIKTEIVPYNNSVDLSNVTKESLGQELGKISPSGGITLVKISDTNSLAFEKAANLFNFLGISLPGALGRTLKDQYIVGVISQDKNTSPFLVITVNDFGNAFSSMLEWETTMEKDLSFLNTATTTGTDTFVWKDIIIKNKDTRGLANQRNQARIIYTFLDKNTILITNSISAIGAISSAYDSRSVVR